MKDYFTVMELAQHFNVNPKTITGDYGPGESRKVVPLKIPTFSYNMYRSFLFHLVRPDLVGRERRKESKSHP